MHFVELKVDGVAFETECDSQDKAMALVFELSQTLGLGYKYEWQKEK